MGGFRGFFGWEDGLCGKSLVTGGPPMWTGKGRAGVCSPSCFSSCTETDSGGGENPNSAPGPAAPPPERVHLPLPAPGRGALKKTKKTALCPFSLTHCPQPQLCSSVFGPPPGSSAPTSGRMDRRAAKPNRVQLVMGWGEPGGLGAFFLPNPPPCLLA